MAHRNGKGVISTTVLEAESCEEYLELPHSVQFSRRLVDDRWLGASASSRIRSSLPLLFYLLDQEGFLMVFKSYGRGPVSTHIGARVFYFFPRQSRMPHAFCIGPIGFEL